MTGKMEGGSMQSSGGGPKKTNSTSSEGVRDAVSKSLREAYGKLVLEPVPDRFTELLDKLDEAQRSSDTDGGATDSSKDSSKEGR